MEINNHENMVNNIINELSLDNCESGNDIDKNIINDSDMIIMRVKI